MYSVAVYILKPEEEHIFECFICDLYKLQLFWYAE